MIRKKIFLVYSSKLERKITINVKTDLFAHCKEIFPLKSEKFNITQIHDKLNILEKLVLLLNDKLNNRKTPEPPSILYLPENQMYRNIKIFGGNYRLLQGNEFDNEILMINNIKELVRECLKLSVSLEGKFISRKGEAFISEK